LYQEFSRVIDTSEGGTKKQNNKNVAILLARNRTQNCAQVLAISLFTAYMIIRCRQWGLVPPIRNCVVCVCIISYQFPARIQAVTLYDGCSTKVACQISRQYARMQSESQPIAHQVTGERAKCRFCSCNILRHMQDRNMTLSES
jgi:hypothetical protein